MSKHTPGPWHYGSYQIEADDGTLVCNMSGWRGPEKTKANARLIAQAPRLLEALKDALAEIECLVEANECCSDHTFGAMEEARAAIAAATGL